VSRSPIGNCQHCQRGARGGPPAFPQIPTIPQPAMVGSKTMPSLRRAASTRRYKIRVLVNSTRTCPHLPRRAPSIVVHVHVFLPELHPRPTQAPTARRACRPERTHRHRHRREHWAWVRGSEALCADAPGKAHHRVPDKVQRRGGCRRYAPHLNGPKSKRADM
jgi:hypothetical protein